MTESALLFGREGIFRGIGIELPESGLEIGRDGGGEGRLMFPEDSDLSRRHCFVKYDTQRHGFIVTDLGSTNGCFLLPQDQRLVAQQATFCSAGQLIRLGKATVFELKAPAQHWAEDASGGMSGHAGIDTGPAPVDNSTTLPILAEKQFLDGAALRVEWQRFYLALVCLPSVLAAPVIGYLVLYQVEIALQILALVLLTVVMAWISWSLFKSSVLGNSVRVGPAQYPQLHDLIVRASEVLQIEPPTVLILQGNGIFDIFVARHYSRRGLLLMTSNMLDNLTEHRSSRELMFFIGRQLGMIADGYFDYTFIKHRLGALSSLAYLAWNRRCHLTADRMGLMVCGDVDAAEHAMLILAAGTSMAANTNLDALRQQRAEVLGSFWGWVALGLSSYPYMVDRITRLREFAEQAARKGIAANAPLAVGALPIRHRVIRALPLIVLHGHDMNARLELVSFLQGKFPHVRPVLMLESADGAHSLPEKFERLGLGARGALVLLTPDDLGLARNAPQNAAARARQNVILEIGWFWARLGRHRMLLLARGPIELPSDLSGVDMHRFNASPLECSEAVRDFIASLEAA